MKILGLIILVISIILSLLWNNRTLSEHNIFAQQKSNQTINTKPAKLTAVPTPTPTPKRIIGIPEQLIIDKIGVNTNIQSVTKDAAGRMGVPTNFVDAGWYSLGVKPGEIGNAVIDGHYDTYTGAPGVFYNLSDLSSGDEITVIDSNNNKLIFIVTDIKYYDYNNAPLDYIFGNDDRARLNLITCAGTFDRSTKNYTKRTIVYSELLQ